VVDVPGHERFIRNMLAGAHGIDLVLFTVAADDGVMPQTEEHLDILHFLGVQRAIFVITKADLVSESRIREVEEEIQILSAGTSLEHSPMIPFSFTTGQGLDAIRAEIARILQSIEKPESQGYFRLPVDRVFVLQGHGVVVTGTALSGAVHVGDRVRCLPGDHVFRVRSLQVHNEPVETAFWGQRVAINLTGQEKPAIERGHVVCHDAITQTSDRFDAWMEVRPTASNGIKNHQRVRVHHGTAERLGKVTLLGPHEKLAPKSSSFCQIALTEPLLVLRGDHFIVRDETAQATLGGGVVIHPWARKHKRAEPKLQEKLSALHTGDLAAAVEAFLDESEEFALPISSLQQFVNLRREEVQARLDRLETIRTVSIEGEKLYTSRQKWRELEARLRELLGGFHAAHPLLAGMEMEEAREKLPYRIAPRGFRAVLDELEAAKVVVRDANLLRLPQHTIQLRSEELGLVARIRARLEENPLAPPELKQIEKDVGVERSKLVEVIRLLERDRAIVRVATDLYFARGSIEQMKSALSRYLAEKVEITPASFRDLFGTSRKYTIPLLEYFDREGLTIRVGDVRKLRK
jgi:selenocysteine-specific elongation factor